MTLKEALELAAAELSFAASDLYDHYTEEDMVKINDAFTAATILEDFARTL